MRAALAADEIAGARAVGSDALKSDPFHRPASFAVEDIAAHGTAFPLAGRAGTAKLTRVPGTLNGIAGRFEWIVDKVGNLTHQMFVQGGTINGIPIRPWGNHRGFPTATDVALRSLVKNAIETADDVLRVCQSKAHRSNDVHRLELATAALSEELPKLASLYRVVLPCMPSGTARRRQYAARLPVLDGLVIELVEEGSGVQARFCTTVRLG